MGEHDLFDYAEQLAGQILTHARKQKYVLIAIDYIDARDQDARITRTYSTILKHHLMTQVIYSVLMQANTHKVINVHGVQSNKSTNRTISILDILPRI
jgi:hypothetical protein